MIDMRYKPYFLPQINIPYNVVLQKLDDEGIGYNMVEVDPDELIASQGITFSDEVDTVNLDDLNPIWINNEMKVLDGHHRWVKALLSNIPIKAVKINMNDKDACRLLNKIQDIHEYEENQKMEEVVNNDVINDENDINNYYTDSKEFLGTLEEENAVLQGEEPQKNQKTLIAYRKEPIMEESVVGNFFTLNPIDDYGKYEIEFDNLLDTNELGIEYKDTQEPVDILAKIWFPNINFEKLSQEYKMPSNNLKSRAIAEKAAKYGYDGIKYGDKLIQGLK